MGLQTLEPERPTLNGPDADTGAVRAAQTLRNAIRATPGQHADGLEHVAEEVPVAMVYNGISHAVMLASPLDLEDFGLGFSLTEGIITRPAELYDIDVRSHCNGIEVRMRIGNRAFEALKSRRRSLAGRTGCGLCGVDSLAQMARPVPPVLGGPPIADAAIHRAMAQLSQRQTLHALTGAVHAAGWARAEGDLLYVREDLGRHNAMDKLIGALSRRGVSPTDGFAVVTSRASYEMVLKIATFGGSLLAAISAPTGLAIDLAGQARITLCGFVRKDRMMIYHDARP
jgi:FdhD protein